MIFLTVRDEDSDSPVDASPKMLAYMLFGSMSFWVAVGIAWYWMKN